MLVNGKFQAQSAYQLINSLAKQLNAQTSLTATDTGSFVDVGTAVLATGKENVLGAIAVLIGQRLIDARPYTGAMKIVKSMSTGEYSHRIEMTSFYPSSAVDDMSWNTNTQNKIVDGDASAPTMYKKAFPEIYTQYFENSNVWSRYKTITLNQLKMAFRNEAEFMKFMNGWAVEWANDIEQDREAWTRTAVLNYMGGLYKMGTATQSSDDKLEVRPEVAVNLTSAFNTRFNTEYTTKELQTDYIKDFSEFLTVYIGELSAKMAIRSKNYHFAPKSTKGFDLLRHSPKSNQRLFLYAPLFRDERAYVEPEIFKTIPEPNYEAVEFWQAFDANTRDNNAKISLSNAGYLDLATGEKKTGTNAVSLNYVVGVLFDEDAIITDYQFDGAYSTPIEASQRFYTLWYFWARGFINNFSHNGVLLYMAD